MTRLTHLVTQEEDGLTAEKLFRTRLGLSRHMLSRLKFTGGLTLDGRQVFTTAPCRAGQTLCALFPEAAEAWPGLKGRGGEPRILYEDAHLMVIDKAAPLATLASPQKDGESLEAAVYHHFGEPERFCFRPVSRLDKGTSGLMAAALHPQAQAALQKQLHTPDMIRQYLAVTDGIPPMDQGTIDLPIGKPNPDSVRRAVMPDGRRAVTHYRLIHTDGVRSLIRLRLDTGRTHQIRVHLSALGCPVTGDYLYGTPLNDLGGRFALHSCSLTLRHPVTGENMAWSSPLPNELAALIRDLPTDKVGRER